MNENYMILIPIICGPIGMLMIVLVIYIIARTRQRRAELQAQVQTKLIDKFSSAPELIAFLKSDEGQHFLGDMENMPRLNARDRIVRGMGKAMVLGLLGIGFLVVGFIPATYNEFCIVVGFLFLFLGAGMLASALLSLKLSRNWGLMEEQPPHMNA